ncbi:tetratricopeptide repeat protein [Gaetbulibacter aestuarii]|uniref:Tetratricopeptide repeat protein n=2 Tax=Gaetbulibacter aestuarii TaxID=1502358 RepID=A0ABW7MWJ2_9FLAO
MKKILYLLLLPATMFGQNALSGVEVFLQNKQYDKAEQLIKVFLEKEPNNQQAIELLGDSYGYQKKWDNALEEYKKLIELNSNNADYHYKYGGVLGMKALENKFKALSYIGDVKASFLKAIELDPKHIEARWALVELYMQLPGIFGGSKTKSLKYAHELLDLSKLDGYLALGYVYEYDNQPELAEKYYKMGIDESDALSANSGKKRGRDSKTPQGALNRNALYYQLGKVAAEYNIDLEKGEACLHTYIRNYSSKDGVPKAWAHYRLAQIQMHKQNKKEALKYIDLALAELPQIKSFKAEKQKILDR